MEWKYTYTWGMSAGFLTRSEVYCGFETKLGSYFTELHYLLLDKNNLKRKLSLL